MAYRDTIDKIIRVYLAGLCRKPFVYAGEIFEPRPVTASPLLLRGFTCPANCGACCAKYTLDYLPSEPTKGDAKVRLVQIQGRHAEVFSDLQTDVKENRCRNLDRTTGRCGIYDRRPFGCDFELIRVLLFSDKVVLTQKLYGRGWAMQRIDGEHGAQCEMLPPDPRTVAEVDRKLERLQEWADHFGVVTCIPDVLAWIRQGDKDQALHLPL
jgi:hypothetical protein